MNSSLKSVVRRASAILLLGPLAFAAGCGVGLSGTGLTSANGANLTGNWLIDGAMPNITPVATLGQTPSFGLAMSFDVVANQVVASGFANVPCNNSVLTGFGFGTVASGTLNSDGTFTLTTPTPPNTATAPAMTLTVHGTAPTATRAAWSGSYTVTFNTTSLGTLASCSFTKSASFTATAIQPVTGTYVGTGTQVNPTTFSATPVTVTMKLQQGATVTAGSSASLYEDLLLTGTVSIQGSSCLTTGTMSAPSLTTTTASVGVVQGNQVLGSFVMADGSTLTLDGSVADTASSRIATPFLFDAGGTCGGSAGGVTLQMKELDRQ